ncbi:MAG: LuxR C-terminal-related transcriptional regulator [Nodosilinea sp.]
MNKPIADLPSPSQLLLDLQRVNKIAQRLSVDLAISPLARHVTDGLVEQFGCAFARVWVVEPDQTALKLVASSGLYTHTDGSFARVPMGAYKVGKIAQNRVPFLSNQLAEEAWVKDRDWALANNIRGFAGYPLMTQDRVIGVLATFSYSPMAPEFLEVLQVLCMTTTIVLDAALRVQPGTTATGKLAPVDQGTPLSEQLAAILTVTPMTLVGTERPLSPTISYVFLRLAEGLNQLSCDYSRLSYGATAVALEALVTLPDGNRQSDLLAQWRSRSDQIRLIATAVGGTLQTQPGPQTQVVQVALQLPYEPGQVGIRVSIQCRAPLVQLALTTLAYQAGLTVGDALDRDVIVLTDHETVLQTSPLAIWVRFGPTVPIPPQATTVLDSSVDAAQLRVLVEQLAQGQPVAPPPPNGINRLSEREQEIMALLARGLRDRDIANRLFISESTVKFHINNSLTKLQSKNRYQAVYRATTQGWI